jgi:Tol biopolymer transport system component
MTSRPGGPSEDDLAVPGQPVETPSVETGEPAKPEVQTPEDHPADEAAGGVGTTERPGPEPGPEPAAGDGPPPDPEPSKATPPATAPPTESPRPQPSPGDLQVPEGERKTRPGQAAAGPSDGTPTELGSGEPPIVCWNCKTVNDPQLEFCIQCSEDLRNPPGPKDPGPPIVTTVTSGPNVRMILIGLAGIAALIIVVLILANLFSDDGGGASPSPSTTVVPPTGTPSPELPTPSPTAFVEGDPTGWIVFAAGGSGAHELQRISADGGAIERLTDPAADATDAAFSANGNRLAYRTKDGIRILDLTTREITVFTQAPRDTNPFWSPIDDVIVFAGVRGDDPQLEILKLRIGDATPTALTNNQVEDHDPSFSADGKRIVFAFGTGAARELMVMDADGVQVNPLTTNAFEDVDPAFSPDGKRIVFARRDAEGNKYIWILELESGIATQIPDLPGGASDPAWSPGGRYVVFATAGGLMLYDTVDGSADMLYATTTGAGWPAWN